VTIQVGGYDFEQVTYDEIGDVLYLRNLSPGGEVSTHGTTEGHAVRLDAEGRVIGMTIVNARWLIERDKTIVVTVPQLRIEASAKDIGLALERSTSR
jgi:uncharacterized protein YuzE